MRGKAQAAHGFFDAPLAVEVRDARPLVRRSHRCVDVVFDAGLARERRKTLALRLFPLNARLRRVLHAEDAPRARQRTSQRRLVIEIALEDLDATTRQRRRPLAVRHARQAAQMEPGALQRPRDRAALIARDSGDENRAIARHGSNLIESWRNSYAARAFLGVESARPTFGNVWMIYLLNPKRSVRNLPIASSACAEALIGPMIATNPCGMPVQTSSRASTPAAIARSTYRRESSSSTSSSPT